MKFCKNLEAKPKQELQLKKSDSIEIPNGGEDDIAQEESILDIWNTFEVASKVVEFNEE